MKATDLEIVAVTGERFADFAPCVPAISDDGVIAFRFESQDGSAAIAIVRDSKISIVRVGNVESHPALNSHGDLAFYTEIDGVKKVWVGETDGTGLCFGEIAGELGPTMNVWGDVAYRAVREGRECAVFLSGHLKLKDPVLICGRIGFYGASEQAYERWHDHWVTPLPLETQPKVVFKGLPVVDVTGRVFYRVDDTDGSSLIRVSGECPVAEVVRTGDQFESLGSFPACNAFGDLVFAGQLAGGVQGIFKIRRRTDEKEHPYGPYWDRSFESYRERQSLSTDGEIHTVIDSSAGFESFRGALIEDSENVVFYATPRGGSLGIYDSNGRILGISDPFQGSIVVDFALNPVSINRHGDFVFRVTLEDGRQMIVKSH